MRTSSHQVLHRLLSRKRGDQVSRMRLDEKERDMSDDANTIVYEMVQSFCSACQQTKLHEHSHIFEGKRLVAHLKVCLRCGKVKRTKGEQDDEN